MSPASFKIAPPRSHTQRSTTSAFTPRPSPPPLSMATTHSLPREILYRIIELGSPWPAALWKGPSKSYTFLRHASLVSRSWCFMAQQRLWKRVCLGYNNTGETYMAGDRVRRRTTTELSLAWLAQEAVGVQAAKRCTLQGAKECRSVGP